MAGVIYVLVNEAMPGMVKIGKTDGNVEDRMTQLYNGVSGLPLPFECHFAAKVEDADKTENTLHKLFSEQRINPKREFFRVDPEKVVLAISIGSFKDVTPREQPVESAEDAESVEKAKKRRSKINLQAINIPVGAELVFSRDPTKTAKVIDEKQVEFDGEITSLSASALKILKGMGYTSDNVSGSVFWMYGDETLEERRQTLDEEQFGETP
jgi:hypothetical protein